MPGGSRVLVLIDRAAELHRPVPAVGVTGIDRMYALDSYRGVVGDQQVLIVKRRILPLHQRCIAGGIAARQVLAIPRAWIVVAAVVTIANTARPVVRDRWRKVVTRSSAPEKAGRVAMSL